MRGTLLFNCSVHQDAEEAFLSGKPVEVLGTIMAMPKKKSSPPVLVLYRLRVLDSALTAVGALYTARAPSSIVPMAIYRYLLLNGVKQRLLFDDCHPTEEGHELIATEVARAIVQLSKR